MKLVIAEKPSVAMSLAAVLGATERKDGYLEGSGYLVSWCVGHLLELAQPEAYKEQYAKWRYEDLPILPENWKYEVPKDKKTQLALLCRLMKDKRVDSVVCATDAGREGELIFRLVYEYAGCKKPMERLWISSMEDAAIREGFDHLHPGSDYDKLYDAAVCRAGADWLIGINATRLFSVLYGVTLNVGRVMSPTLALLVQRESDIESFISKPFYVPEITCGGFTASGEKMTERSEAEKIRMDCDHKTSPPKHYTEDTLLSAMETAGAEDMPEDAERKGLGTPATRAATLEKLVSAGFVQRKKKQLIPTEKGKNLIAVLPDNIKSPILTAEWESMLKQVEHGELSATSFMDQIADMSRTLVKEHTTPEERFADLFPSSRGTAHEAVGVCPRCGAPVYEGKKGFFCDNRECSFALWKDNRFFSSKKKSITKSVAAALLKEGRISMSGLYSEKTGKTYDAEVILDDTGGKYVNFKLEFPVKKQPLYREVLQLHFASPPVH